MDLFQSPVERATERMNNLMAMWKATHQRDVLSALRQAIDDYVSLTASAA